LFDIDEARTVRPPVVDQWGNATPVLPAVSMSEISASATKTPIEFFAELSDDIASMLETLTRCEKTIDERCAEAGGESISFRPLREVLEKMRTELRGLGYDPSGLGAAMDVDGDGAAAVNGVAVGGMPVDVTSIRGRDDAYRLLGVIQEYLQRIEPHSPAPYLIGRAIAWGRMSLADLLKELLEENADLHSIYRLLGIREPQEQ
jgi:type VI secretion system protein ImpA